MIAFVLSILLPGLGQFYYGRYVRAVLMVFLGLTPLYPLVLIWTIVDVVILNKEGATPAYTRKDAVWAIIILVVIVPVFIIITGTGLLAVGNWYSEKYVLPEQAGREGQDIVAAMLEFKASHGHLPDQIVDLTNGYPLRSGWLKDSWGEAYYYEKVNDGAGYRLISKGPDRKIDTKDDLILK